MTPVVGGNDDSELLESVARESDVVIHTADSSDHLPSTESLLRGLSKRFEATGKAPLYLHTSGTGVLADKARGGALSSKIYSDDNESIDTLADTQPHRNVDLAVKKAGLGGKVRCHIVIPPIIYGISKGPFKRDTFFLAPGIRAAIKDGKAGYVGSGAPRWNTVHVDDLAEFYLLLLQKAGDERWGGYYFAETGNVSFKEIAEAAAKALGEKIGKSVPVASWTPEEAKKNCRGVGGVFIWGSNCEPLGVSYQGTGS